jgi:hypothetical protein
VERVVNRLVIESRPGAPAGSGLGMPASTWSMVGGTAPTAYTEQSPAGEARKPRSTLPAALFASAGQPRREDVQLTGAVAPGGRSAVTVTAGGRTTRPPQPLAAQNGRPLGMPAQVARMPAGRGGVRPAGMGEPMTLPAPGGYGGPAGDGQIVPGTVRYSEGSEGGGGAVADYGNGGGGGAPGGYSAGPGGAPGGMQGGYAGGPGGYAGAPGGYSGGPMPMGGTGVGMPPVPVRGDGPNMPNYAWPSYSAYPNYAALQYPTQYSPTAWPYIGPFYPYPQVPLGWRRVSLEWDDGWWWLDFDERHIHSHHR